MAELRVAFVMYPVTDLPKALAFYRDTLGLSPGELSSDAWVEFDVAGTTFGIGNFEQVGKPGSAQSLALEVADIDAFRARLTARGVESSEPYALPSCRISVVADPDGNQIWLHQTDPSRLTG